ncbi:MAG: HAD family phosphatase [Candidatus Nanopelagicales bacterium]
MSDLRGLVIDWGGVLTTGLPDVVARWADEADFDPEHYRSLMREWFGPEVALEARFNPVHALERGEMSVPDFESRLAEGLTRLSGQPTSADGLLARMFTYFEHAPDMAGLVRRAHEAGIRTALLSNSWGNDYPRDGWEEMFDVVVISGEVGMRKPDAEIFEHTLGALGLTARECVFVDDLAHNVEAAVSMGFVGVRHTSYAATAQELETLFGVALSA